MRVPDAEVRRHVVECVKSFYGCVAPKELPDGTDWHPQPKTRTLPSDSRFTKLSLSEVPSWVSLWLSHASFYFPHPAPSTPCSFSFWPCFLFFCFLTDFYLNSLFHPVRHFPPSLPSRDALFSVSLLHTGLQSTSPGYRLQLLERSDLAQTLLLSMAVLEEQPHIRLQLLQTLQILSCASGPLPRVILGSSGKVEAGLSRQSGRPGRVRAAAPSL